MVRFVHLMELEKELELELRSVAWLREWERRCDGMNEDDEKIERSVYDRCGFVEWHYHGVIEIACTTQERTHSNNIVSCHETRKADVNTI